jgi:hypothetical protein
MFGSFNGICSRLELCFLDEVAPAFVPIVGVLGILERLQFRFGVVLAPHHSDHASGAVGADVMPDDGVRGIEVVACQKESIPSLAQKQLTSSFACPHFTSYGGDAPCSQNRVLVREKASAGLRSLSCDGRSGSVHPELR